MEYGYCGSDHLLGMWILWIRPFICSLDIVDSDHPHGVWIFWMQTSHMESGYCGSDHLLGMWILWIRPFICSLDIVDSDHPRGVWIFWMQTIYVEAQWLGGRMLDSRSREPGHESPTHVGAVEGDSLWRCYATAKQNPCMYLNDTWQ